MSSSPFCPCPDHECEFNPVNHDKGCNLCIEDSIKTKEIPRCFFMQIKEDLGDRDDWSFEGFADFVIKKGE